MNCNKIITAVLSLAGITISCQEGNFGDFTINSAQLEIAVANTPNVKVTSDTIFVLKNTPIEYAFTGNPDNIVHWSGEYGKKYVYRDRLTYATLQPELLLNISKRYGQGAANSKNYTGPGYQTYGIRLFYTQDMPGLSLKYAQDSLAIKTAKWTPLEDNVAIKEFTPKVLDPWTNEATGFDRGPYDLSKIDGKFRLGIKILYPTLNPQTNPENGFGATATTYPTYTISGMQIKGMEEGTTIERYMPMSLFGLNPFTMNQFWFGPYYNASTKHAGATQIEAYKTYNPYWSYISKPTAQKMPNSAHMWELTAIGDNSPNIIFRGGADATSPFVKTTGMEVWLISDELDVSHTPCASDKGEGIKDMTRKMAKYTYTYTETGVNNVTFTAGSYALGKQKNDVKNFVVKVVDSLP